MQNEFEFAGSDLAYYALREIKNSLSQMYEGMSEDEQLAFDLGEMFGLIEAALDGPEDIEKVQEIEIDGRIKNK